MNQGMQWYDSVWLAKYLAARDIVGRVAPEKRGAFVDAFTVLQTDPNFVVCDVPNVFDAETLARIREVIRSIPMTEMEMHEVKRFGRLVVHDHLVFSELQRELVPLVSRLAGEEVEPRYNFLSLYTRMGVCEPHLDAPSAKWTLDVCIDQSAPWPIHFSQIVPWPEDAPIFEGDWQGAIKAAPHLKFHSKVLTPGNGILFSGSSQWHYRDPLGATSSGGHCDLLFFHFIPKGAGEIISPRNWARLFDVPELAQISGIDRDY